MSTLMSKTLHDTRSWSDTNKVLVYMLPQWATTLLLSDRNRQERPHCAHYALPVWRTLAELGLLGRIEPSNFESLLVIFGHWTATDTLVYVIFYISKDKHTRRIIDSINCRNNTVSQCADSGSSATSECENVFKGLRSMLVHIHTNHNFI